ncbi:probable methyltransferase PMT28 isoform X1 [Tanacetum coccineum]
MERGLLSSGSKGNNKKDERKDKGTVFVDLAKRIKNIDGKVVGKDGKPLKMPIRNVKTSVQGIANDNANVIGGEGNVDDVSATMGVNASDWIKLQPSNVLNVKPLNPFLKINNAGVVPSGVYKQEGCVENGLFDNALQTMIDGAAKTINQVDVAATFGVPLITFQDLNNLTKDIDAGKYEDLWSGMDSDQRDALMVAIVAMWDKIVDNPDIVDGSSPLMKKGSYASVVHASEQITSTNEDSNSGVQSGDTHSMPVVAKKIYFRSLVNEEKVENADTVLPMSAIEKVKNRWTPNVSLKKNEVTKVPVWVKLHNVPVVAYSADGLSLIATQVGNPIMLDAYTSSMCEDPWVRINFARVLVELNANSVLKHEVSMAIPLEDGSGHTREVIKVEYEWKPPHCADCKIFGHTNEKCPKRAINLDTPSESGKGPIVPSTASTNCDGFTEVRRKKIRGTNVKGTNMDNSFKVNKVNTLSTSNSFDAFNNMEEGVSSSRKSQEVDHETGPKTSQWNEDHESDTEVDEFIFPEGDKFGDQFDIRLKDSDTDVDEVLLPDIGTSFPSSSFAVDPLDIASKVKDIEGKKEGRKAVREGSRADDAALPFSGVGLLLIRGFLVSNISLHVFEDEQVLRTSDCKGSRIDWGDMANCQHCIDKVSSRFENTLYGYFVGKRLAYQVVENYVNNVWSKYGLKRIQLHGEFFLFQFETKEGMNRVLDYGSWLIRRVPLILNIWSPNCDLHKAEIKKVPVWVKLHNVPIVAYSEVGLSLITTQIGKPIQLNAYTSDMCLNSWGRSAYARALIEISADVILKEDLVIAIPIGKDKGHTLATIQIEYEWRPPRCSTCLIFDHTDDKCPKLPKVVSHDVVTNVGVNHSKDVADDGFEVVKKKRNKKKKHQKQVDGVVLSKPSLKTFWGGGGHYRRVDKGNSTKQSGSNVASTSKVGKATSTSDHTKNVRLENSFSVLNNDEEMITLWLFKLWLEVNVALQLHSIVLIGLFGNIFYQGRKYYSVVYCQVSSCVALLRIFIARAYLEAFQEVEEVHLISLFRVLSSSVRMMLYCRVAFNRSTEGVLYARLWELP